MKVAMQFRCVFCWREQYIPDVYEISFGKRACVWCGKMSERMSETAYRCRMEMVKVTA